MSWSAAPVVLNSAPDRVCPGRHFATRTLFLNIACILTLLDIKALPGEKLEAKFDETFSRYATTS
jgi:hypothetical protein